MSKTQPKRRDRRPTPRGPAPITRQDRGPVEAFLWIATFAHDAADMTGRDISDVLGVIVGLRGLLESRRKAAGVVHRRLTYEQRFGVALYDLAPAMALCKALAKLREQRVDAVMGELVARLAVYDLALRAGGEGGL